MLSIISCDFTIFSKDLHYLLHVIYLLFLVLMSALRPERDDATIPVGLLPKSAPRGQAPGHANQALCA